MFEDAQKCIFTLIWKAYYNRNSIYTCMVYVWKAVFALFQGRSASVEEILKKFW